MRETIVACLIPLLLLAPSCGLFAGSIQEVTVTTDEPAEVWVRGTCYGPAPVAVDLHRARGGAIRAVARDGRAGIVNVGSETNTVFVLDIVGGFLFLVPFLGLFGNGGHDLEVDEVLIHIPGDPDVAP